MNKKGFTLVETLLVLVIIAIIASIVMINVTNIMERTEKRGIEASLRTIRTSLQMYYLENRQYPQISVSGFKNEVRQDIEDEIGEYVELGDLFDNLTDNDMIEYKTTSTGYEFTIIINDILERITLTEEGVGGWEEEI